MTEILTESFCERCGTRYTFESAAPRKSRLGRVRVLGKGMRNFVLSDDASLAEAMADARSEDEIAATAHQLDAFHQTFNFCLTCRQYTCGDCWNTGEGRCLTCAPIPGMELPVAEVAPLVAVEAEPLAAEATNGHAADDAWPDADLSSARLARALGMDEAEAGTAAVADAEGLADAAVADAEGLADAAVADGEGLADADGLPVAAAAAPAGEVGPGATDDTRTGQLIGIPPGQSLEEAIAEYEARIAADEAAELAATLDTPASEAVDAMPLAGADAAQAVATDEGDHDALAAMAAAALAGLARDDLSEAAPEPEPVVAVDADAEAEALREVAAEQVLVAEAETEQEITLEPVAAVAAEAAVEVDIEPDAAAAVAAESEPVAEVDAIEPEPEPVAAAADSVEDAAPRDDVVAQPVWPTPAPPAGPPVAPSPGEQAPPANPWLTVAPEDPGSTPQWPTTPAWPTAATRRDVPATLAGRPLLAQPDPSGLWAASAREVLTASAVPVPEAASAAAPTAQPCVSCGLSLSANARFCRRCGTRQG